MLTFFYCFQDLCLPFNFSDRTFRSCPFKWDYIADASFYNESVYLPLEQHTYISEAGSIGENRKIGKCNSQYNKIIKLGVYDEK